MIFVTSHIPNLDEILEGGFNKPSIVLVAGAAGSGKTTLADPIPVQCSKGT